MTKPSILVVEARFYADIADELAAGAAEVLHKHGYLAERITVPGVFEIPAAISYAIKSMEQGAASHSFAGFVSLGCVIRGETSHYDYVCSESARKLMDLAVDHNVAHGFGVITCENGDQAWARAKRDQKNVGGRAAEACIRMIELQKQLHLIPH